MLCSKNSLTYLLVMQSLTHFSLCYLFLNHTFLVKTIWFLRIKDTVLMGIQTINYFAVGEKKKRELLVHEIMILLNSISTQRQSHECVHTIRNRPWSIIQRETSSTRLRKPLVTCLISPSILCILWTNLFSVFQLCI